MTYWNIFQKYGHIVRITPTHVSIAHKDAISVVYAHGSKSFNKSDFYHAFVSNKPSVFSTTNRRDHAHKRRIVSQAFSFNALRTFSPFIRASVELFVEKMDTVCSRGTYVDAITWLNYLTFDCLSDLAFGEAIGMLREVSDSFHKPEAPLTKIMACRKPMLLLSVVRTGHLHKRRRLSLSTE